MCARRMLYPSSTMLGARFSATVRNPDPCVSHKRDRAPARTRGPAHDMLHATAHRSPRRAVKRRWGRPQHHCAVAQSLWSRAPLSPLHCAQSPITSRPRPSEHPSTWRAERTPGIGAQGDTRHWRARRHRAGKSLSSQTHLPSPCTANADHLEAAPEMLSTCVCLFCLYTMCSTICTHYSI